MAKEADWRGLVSSLLGDATAVALARVLLGEVRGDNVPGLSAKKSRRALEVLRPYLREDHEGSEVSIDRETLQTLLQPAGERSHDGQAGVVSKFVSTDLRLKVFPSRPEHRRVVLEFLAHRLFKPHDDLREVQVNERLKVVTDDFVTLRRYLIDFGLLTRLNNGTSYRLENLD